MRADLDVADEAVKAEEAGPLRQQHAALIGKIAMLNDLAALDHEGSERAELLRIAEERDAALLKAGSSLLRELYQFATAVLDSDDWSDPFLCPVCDTKTTHRLQKHVADNSPRIVKLSR